MSSPDISPAGSSNVGSVTAVTPAIRMTDATKVYRLFGSLHDQVLDSLGVSRLLFWGNRKTYQEFHALRGVTLNVDKGERVGIIGRNGAGKTTLLKLITGNFAPTSGTIEVNGTVQALMQTGLGFHPEFSGYENIRSALHYNGLVGSEFENALANVADFVELEDFLHQPMKTYSAGMVARVQFAAATAIKPDILIVDEILGAGDAYFSSKSAHRMDKLASSGCTLLLVSHSMQQVLQFCDRAVWLEGGSIVLESESLHVVKAYEEFTQKLERENERLHRTAVSHTSEKRKARRLPSLLDGRGGEEFERKQWLRERLLEEVLGRGNTKSAGSEGQASIVSMGGVSRWDGGERGLKIANVRVIDEQEREVLGTKTSSPLDIEIEIVSEQGGEYPCYFVVVLFTDDGRCLSRHCSDKVTLVMNAGEHFSQRLHYPKLLLGNGTYAFSAAIYKTLDLKKLGEAQFYDLLSRSFQFRVTGPYADDLSIFYHPAEWKRPRKVLDAC